MDDGRHEAKNASRSLKPVECGPVAVESVEELRMNWVSRSEPSFVVGLAALGWEFLRLAAIHLGKGVNDGITLRK
jgi:hypothetical protein